MKNKCTHGQAARQQGRRERQKDKDVLTRFVSLGGDGEVGGGGTALYEAAEIGQPRRLQQGKGTRQRQQRQQYGGGVTTGGMMQERGRMSQHSSLPAEGERGT